MSACICAACGETFTGLSPFDYTCCHEDLHAARMRAPISLSWVLRPALRPLAQAWRCALGAGSKAGSVLHLRGKPGDWPRLVSSPLSPLVEARRCVVGAAAARNRMLRRRLRGRCPLPGFLPPSLPALAATQRPGGDSANGASANTRHVAHTHIPLVAGHARPVHRSETPGVDELRRSRYHRLRRVDGQLRCVPGIRRRAPRGHDPGPLARPGRQLRAGKCPLGNAGAAASQPASQQSLTAFDRHQSADYSRRPAVTCHDPVSRGLVCNSAGRWGFPADDRGRGYYAGLRAAVSRVRDSTESAEQPGLVVRGTPAGFSGSESAYAAAPSTGEGS